MRGESARRMSRILRGGDVVPTSGVYATLHSTPHKLIERKLYLKGERFPSCHFCPLGVLYKLEQRGETGQAGTLREHDLVAS